jgi:hypothetical protein
MDDMQEGEVETFGFEPHPLVLEEQNKEPEAEKENPLKRKRGEEVEETEDMKTLKEQISLMMNRYPDLQLRLNQKVMDQLKNMTETELQNIMHNLKNDICNTHGTPAASTLLYLATGITGNDEFQRRCLNDPALKSDVELELMNLIGIMSTKINIIFRLFSHAFNTIFNPRVDMLSEERDAKKSKVFTNESNQRCCEIIEPSSQNNSNR